MCRRTAPLGGGPSTLVFGDGSRDSHSMLKDGLSRLEDAVNSSDGSTARLVRYLRRHSFVVTVVLICFVAIFIGGHEIGASQVEDAGSAEQAGTAAGERRGSAAGEREGYASAFRPARERAYDAAYREAYRAAYRDAFEQAGLAVPVDVKVSGP